MSSENSQREETAGCSEGAFDTVDDTMQTEEFSIGGRPTGSVVSRDDEMQQAAASTLLQLNSRVYSDQAQGDTNNFASGSELRKSSSEYYNAGASRPSYGRPWENIHPSFSRHTANPQDQASATFMPNPILFSQANIQNTISGLTNAISGIQQQQANMHVRQDSITSTLECVLSALQELKDCNSTSVGNSASASSAEKGATGTYLGTKSNSFAQEYSLSAHNGVTPSRAEVGPENSISRSLNEGLENSQINLENQGSQGNMTINFGSNDASGEVRGRSNAYEGRQPRSGQSADNCDYLDITRGRNIQRAGVDRRQTSPVFYGLKLPPFNGKEDWKVWINRFEAIAERRNWSDETKLDNLLPKLQGRAGDFVYTQLPRATLACYTELVKELNSRFRVVETQRAFAAKFSQRSQRADETIEEYAADLKRLYAKAYKFRDNKTRQEDLVRRFLDGMRDSEARFEIEYHKEPDDIDEAVYHAVNFIQTRRRSSQVAFGDKKFKKYVRRANLECDSPSESEEQGETDDEQDRVYRVPASAERPQSRKLSRTGQPTERTETKVNSPEDSMKVLTETRDLIQTLVTQIKEQSQTDKKAPQGNTPQAGKKRFVCYGCQQPNHILRDCPNRTGRSAVNTRPARANEAPQRRGQHEDTEKHPLN